MRTVRITVAAITLASGVLLGLRADGAEEPAAPQPPPTARQDLDADAAAEHRTKVLEQLIKDLSAENNELKLKNRVLELQLKQLRERRPVVVVPDAAKPPVTPEGDRLPEGSEPREFNGIRYYVVPLSESK